LKAAIAAVHPASLLEPSMADSKPFHSLLLDKLENYRAPAEQSASNHCRLQPCAGRGLQFQEIDGYIVSVRERLIARRGRPPPPLPPPRAPAPRWSPDGKRILFTGFRQGQAHSIYVISPDGGSLRPILPSGWEGSEADWSPDGYRVVVAMSNHKAQREQSLYTLEPTTGTVKELANSKGFREPRWSPDGRRIAALDSLRNRVLVYDLQSGEWSEIASGSLLASVHWARDGSAVLFQDQLDGQQSIYRADLASHRVVQALGFAEILRGSATHCLFAGSARDGSFYAMVERGVTDIYTLDLDLP
jgi:hypothetical protein